jgi:hypothetical protein
MDDDLINADCLEAMSLIEDGSDRLRGDCQPLRAGAVTSDPTIKPKAS